MKFIKYLFLVAVIPAMGFMPSSAPTPAGKKAAICTFYVSKYIDVSELGGGAQMVAAIGNLSDDPNFNLQPVLDKFHKIFFDKYVKEFPFEILTEEEVTGLDAYKSYESQWNETGDADRSKLFQRYLTAPGYKPLLEGGLKKENRNNVRMREIFKDKAQGIMFVKMEFSFVKKTAPFTAGIKAFIRIKLWNEEDKKVFAINESAMSKKSVAIVGGIPVTDPSKLIPLCNDAADRLMADLEKRLPKIANRVAKKF